MSAGGYKVMQEAPRVLVSDDGLAAIDCGTPEQARLFAAAPDLLAACKKAERILTYTGLGHGIAREMRAAIAKAEGGQS